MPWLQGTPFFFKKNCVMAMFLHIIQKIVVVAAAAAAVVVVLLLLGMASEYVPLPLCV
jgi:hypothetical protein